MSRRARGVAAVAVAVASTAFACSLGDFTGFSGGNDAPDGSTDGDIGVDSANGSDATSSNDAGSDALTEGMADAARFCLANADAGFFCEDFDGPGDPIAHFEETRMNGGTLVVENGALVVTTPAGAESNVFGKISAKTTGTAARLAFSVRPDQLTTMNGIANQLVKIYFFGATKAYEVGLGVRANAAGEVYVYEYADNSVYTEHEANGPLAANVFTRFVIEVHIAGAGGPHVNVDRDGTRILDNTVLTPPDPNGAIEAVIGIPYTRTGHGTWKFAFDDVVMGLP